MQTKVEQVEKNIVKLTIEVSAEKFEEGMKKAYVKVAKQVNIPGFRKGKAPRKMIERVYGEGVFYDDAINAVCPEAYDAAVVEANIEPVARPEIDIEKISTEEGMVFTATVTVKPEVELAQYKGIEVEKVEYTVTDEDIDAEIKTMQEKNSRMVTVEDRAVENGDITNIDFEGFVDDVAFEGGKGENFDLTIGSGQFIPGFEEQLIGKKIDEEIDVNVSFPEEYHSEELKGKPALFKVKINSIKVKEYPPIDDDFAKDVSEFDTLADLKASIVSKKTEANEKRAKDEQENKILEAVVMGTTIELPEVMVENQIDQLVKDFEMRLRNQGLEMDKYLMYTGMDLDAIRGQFKDQADKQVRTSLVMEKIAQVEAVEVTQEDIDAEMQKIADGYNMELDKVKEMMVNYQDSMKEDIVLRKAMELVVNSAVIK